MRPRTLSILLVTFALAYWLRFDSLQLHGEYVLAILVGLLLSSMVLPGTGALAGVSGIS